MKILLKLFQKFFIIDYTLKIKYLKLIKNMIIFKKIKLNFELKKFK